MRRTILVVGEHEVSVGGPGRAPATVRGGAGWEEGRRQTLLRIYLIEFERIDNTSLPDLVAKRSSRSCWMRDRVRREDETDGV
jgi:hypothetical protein